VFGADRVMYGSNWPVSENLASYRSVLLTVMQYVQTRSANDMYKYFLKNSNDCYKWIDRT
jgi:L-fuconolactonase